MKIKSISLRQKSKGQTMMEYIILIAIVAIASIPVAKILGNVFRSKVLSSADAMVAGESQAHTYTSDAANQVQQGQSKVKRDMSNFDKVLEDE